MSGSETLSIALPTRPANDQVISAATEPAVSTNKEIPAAIPGPCAGPAPRDVERLLACHGAELPHYLDVQREAARQGWRERWAMLRKLPAGSLA